MAQYVAPETSHIGTGTETVFGFAWPYLNPTDVVVTVNGGVRETVFVNAYQIQLVPAPVQNAVVRIYRNTPAQDPMYLFSGGTPFLPRYVDENNKQLLHAVQEGLLAFDQVSANANLALVRAAAAENSAAAAMAASNRAIRVSLDEPGINPLPSASVRAGKLLGFDSNGHHVVLAGGSGDMMELATALAGPDGAHLIGISSDYPGAQKQSMWDVAGRHLTPEMFGAIGDGTPHPLSERYATLAQAQERYPFVTSLTQQIDWAALQAASNIGRITTSVLTCAAKTYIIGDPVVWYGGMFYDGVRGASTWKLAPGSNCSLLVSADISKWASFTAGQSLVDYPYDGGIDGLLLDGNAEFQNVAPTTEADMQYGMHILSHRFGVGWMQVRRINGVGSRTRYNAAIMYAFRTDGVDDYGLQGSHLGSPSPYDFKQINIIDCLYEHFIFQGPADIPIWHITTNYCGWLRNADIPTVARTSLVYPGEEIHSVRIQTACKLGYANLNGALYGRSLYVAPFTRFHGDTIIVTGSWGAIYVAGSAFGSISALIIQQNTYAWGGVYKPGLEHAYGTGSAAGKSKFSFPQVSLRRLTTPVTVNAIGPGIYDDAGGQFGIIDGVDSSPVAGHALVIGARNRGGSYRSVNFMDIQGIAADGTKSAGILIEAGARDMRFGDVRITNCDRGIVNMGVNARFIIRDGTIETSGTQVAMEGVVAESQLAGVQVGVGNISLDNIGSWGLELLHNDGVNTKRYYNRFKDTITVDTTTVGNKELPLRPHTMWRKPTARDLQGAMYSGQIGLADITAVVHSLEADTFGVRATVHTAAPGQMTVTVGFA